MYTKDEALLAHQQAVLLAPVLEHRHTVRTLPAWPVLLTSSLLSSGLEQLYVSSPQPLHQLHIVLMATTVLG